jgi:hypothetical protein
MPFLIFANLVRKQNKLYANTVATINPNFQFKLVIKILHHEYIA